MELGEFCLQELVVRGFPAKVPIGRQMYFNLERDLSHFTNTSSKYQIMNIPFLFGR